MKPYSKDLRLRVLAAVDRGMPRKEVVRVFGVSEPTVRRYLRLRRETGDVEPKPPTGPPAPKGAALDAALPAQKKTLVARERDETDRRLWREEVRELWPPVGSCLSTSALRTPP